jgi:hypothetical protein
MSAPPSPEHALQVLRLAGRVSAEALPPTIAADALDAARRRHERERARVLASLLASPGPEKPSHRRWARAGS